jgi:hypothetical protein
LKTPEKGETANIASNAPVMTNASKSKIFFAQDKKIFSKI